MLLLVDGVTAVVADAWLIRVGEWLVHPQRRRLDNGHVVRALEPRLVDLLVYLAKRPDQVIEVEELLREVWKGTFYGDSPVQRAIALLRKALDDDARSPRYIQTIRKRGYRLIAPVVWPDDYARSLQGIRPDWSGRNPYVGLRPFGADDAEMFFGRDQMRGEVLLALQRQRQARHAFVLVVGASRCGKTSLINAGVMPLLLRKEGFDGMRALSHAYVDLRGANADTALSLLAAGLSRLEVQDWPVFPALDRAGLVERIDSGDLALPIRHALARVPSPEGPGQWRHFLALTVDHVESLMSGTSNQVSDDVDRMRLQACLAMLLEGGDVLIVMACRRDAYPRLLHGLPKVAQWESPSGRVELEALSAGGIADIIRLPAKLAGLRFETDRRTGIGLDDLLRDAAVGNPDVLPILQYVLYVLYENRSADGSLEFSAYRVLGEFDGVLAALAERALASCSAAARRKLPALLSKLTVDQDEDLSLRTCAVRWDMLEHPDERMLAAALVDGSVLVSDRVEDVARIALTHGDFLRAWPRARTWMRANMTWLVARARVTRDYQRWIDGGNCRDLLLRRGLPLDEALALARNHHIILPEAQRGYIEASLRANRMQRRRSLLQLVVLTVAMANAVVALGLKEVAEKRAEECMATADASGYLSAAHLSVTTLVCTLPFHRPRAKERSDTLASRWFLCRATTEQCTRMPMQRSGSAQRRVKGL